MVICHAAECAPGPHTSESGTGTVCVSDSNRSYVLEAGPITTVLTNYPTNLIGARICEFEERESYLNMVFLGAIHKLRYQQRGKRGFSQWLRIGHEGRGGGCDLVTLPSYFLFGISFFGRIRKK